MFGKNGKINQNKMADICMCSGKDCPVKEKCHRFTSLSIEYGQSYFTEPPGKIEDNTFTCDMYWGEQSESIWDQLKNIIK
jgi:hypothetical protein